MNEVEKGDNEQLAQVIEDSLKRIGIIKAASAGDQWRWDSRSLAKQLAVDLHASLHERVLQALSPQENCRHTINTAKVESAIIVLTSLLSFLKSGQDQPEQP